MKKYKAVLAALAITGFSYSSIAQIEMKSGDVEVTLDAKGAISYDDGTEDTTLDDAYFSIDAKLTKYLGAFFEQGYVKDKLDDLDIDEMDVRQMYVSIQSDGAILLDFKLKADVGRQNMAFGEQNSVNAYIDSSDAEALRQQFQAQDGVTITIDRSDANYEGVLGSLSDLARTIEVSYIDKNNNDSEIPDETTSMRIRGRVGDSVDTSVSFLQGDEKDDDGYEVSATLKLDKATAHATDSEMLQKVLNESTVALTYTNLDIAGVKQIINRASVAKGWNDKRGHNYKVAYEYEELEINNSDVNELNTVSFEVNPKQSRFVFGIQYQRNEKTDDDAVAATVKYNMD